MRSTDESTIATTSQNTNISDHHEGCDRDRIRKKFLLAAFMWYFICGIEYRNQGWHSFFEIKITDMVRFRLFTQ